jgi:hypothetical protein
MSITLSKNLISKLFCNDILILLKDVFVHLLANNMHNGDFVFFEVPLCLV